MFQVNSTVSRSVVNFSHIYSVFIVLGSCHWFPEWLNWNSGGPTYKKPTTFPVISTPNWNYEIIHNLEVMILVKLMVSYMYMSTRWRRKKIENNSGKSSKLVWELGCSSSLPAGLQVKLLAYHLVESWAEKIVDVGLLLIPESSPLVGGDILGLMWGICFRVPRGPLELKKGLRTLSHLLEREDLY